MDRLIQLWNNIDRADQAYYNTDTPIVTDEVYDGWKKELKELSPDDERHSRVGAPVPKRSAWPKFKHTCFMGSLNKADNEDDLRKWHKSVGSVPLVASLKADGSSMALYYENGQLVRAVTRGGDDGVGEDVLPNAIMFKNVPCTLNKPLTCAIRGEAVMVLADWLKVDPHRDSNPRNIGNGIVRRLDGTDADKITFLAFDFSMFNDDGSRQYNGYLGQMDVLKRNGLRVIDHTAVEDIDQAIAWYKKVEEGRADLHFWIDGVVFCPVDLNIVDKMGIRDNRPKGVTVLKFEAPGAETTLRQVVLSMGHTGAIIPTGKVDPVQIGGTTVSSVLLNNFQMIADMDLAVGDKVRVIKAKDIIPKVESVLERPASRQPIKEPTHCPVCGHAAGRKVTVDGDEGAVTECKNKTCPSLVSSRLSTYISKLNILGVGDEVLTALVEQLNVREPADLYEVTTNPQALAQMTVGNGKFGTKRAKTLIDQINAKRELPLNILLGSLGIPHLGRRRAQLIIEATGDTMMTLESWRDGTLLTVADKASIPGIAPAIQDGINAFGQEIDNLLKHVIVTTLKKEEKKMSAAGGKCAGSVYCFTGKIERVGPDGKRFTREMMENLVLDNGGAVTDGIKSNTTVLVQADPSSQSTKTQKAKQMGIEIMSEADFFKRLGM